jgi:hypothetical protein
MTDKNELSTVLFSCSLVTIVLYTSILWLGYYFYAQFTLTPSKYACTGSYYRTIVFSPLILSFLTLSVTANIGRDYSFKDIDNSAFLKSVASLGIICNLQVGAAYRIADSIHNSIDNTGYFASLFLYYFRLHVH